MATKKVKTKVKEEEGLTLTPEELSLLNKYREQMESAYKFGWYRALPSTDNLTMQKIYQHYINPKFVPRVWCGNCTLTMLKGWYEYFTKQ